MLISLTLAALPAIVTPLPLPLAGPNAVHGVATHDRSRGDDTSEMVRLITRDRLQIQASYFAPRKSKEKAPGVVLVHDAGSDRTVLEGMAESLQKRGFGTLTLDLRGHGESVTESQNWEAMDESARVSAWTFASRDVAAAMGYLRDQKEIHSAKLTVIGIGAGCNLALTLAEDDRDVRAVVLVNPGESAYEMDTIAGVSDLGGLPCLLVHPKADRELAESITAEAHDANDGHEFVKLLSVSADADEVLAEKRTMSSIIKWLNEQFDSKDK